MPHNGTVYLAGKMTGLTVRQMSTWRNLASTYLRNNGFHVLNPFECFKDELIQQTKPTAREIVGNNKYQIQHSDIVLAELNYADVSIGTVGEIVFAAMLGIPVIAWGRAEDVIDHPWIQDHVTAVYGDLEDALECIIARYSKVG